MDGKALMVVLLFLLCMSVYSQASGENDNCRYTNLTQPDAKSSRITPALDKHEAALLMLLGFGGFSVLVAVIHNAIRHYVYHDLHSLDTIFDAGGKVSLSLTAVTVTSQMLWPADFLQITTNTSMSGLGGALFFVIGVVLDIVLFPILSIELKTKAPGAKTFLQIVHSRFGRSAHILFCFVALLTNLVTVTSLLLAGKSAISVLTKDASDEFIALVLAVLFGSYCFIGGLGTTFYISYFNTALTFVTVLVFVVNISYIDPSSKYTTRESMFEAMRCIEAPEGNTEDSLVTFQSRPGAIFGLSLFFMATSLSFCDQANWQSRIAAKPVQGVLGFFIAGFLFFVLPMNVGLPVTMTYMAMGYENGTHPLPMSDIANGYITPFVMETVMGSTGAYLLITMITMSLMSTGSGEVMAVSSILVYDIYKIYINPFRKNVSATACQLCGKEKINMKDSADRLQECTCTSITKCVDCADDVRDLVNGKQKYEIQYSCGTHGLYRRYEDILLHYKSWCIVWVTLFIIPYGLVVYASKINLNWAIFFLQSLLTPFIVPLLLTVTWAKCTSIAVIFGTITGLLANIAGLLIITATVYETGLNDFFVNSVKDYSLLGGSASGLVMSSLVTVLMSLTTTKIKSKTDVLKEWEKTISIDNPLSPWKRLYQEELSVFPEDTTITPEHMLKVFKTARNVAYIGGFICVTLFLIIIPAVVFSLGILSFDQFSNWLTFCYVTCFIGAAYVVIAPPAEEIYQIIKYKQKKEQERMKVKKSGKSNVYSFDTRL